MNLIVLVGGLTAALLVFASPVYIVAFVVRRIKARRLPPGSAPSYVTLALYLLVIAPAAVGQYNYMSKWKWHGLTVEAKTNLGQIFTAQMSYSGERDSFAGGPSAFEVMGWRPQAPTRYAYYCGQAMIVNTLGESFTARPGPDWPYTVAPETSAQGFTCLAIGDLDGDDFPDVWKIDDAKQLTQIADDIADRPETGLMLPGRRMPRSRWLSDRKVDQVARVAPLVLLPFLLVLGFRDGRRYTRALRQAKEQARVQADAGGAGPPGA